MLLRLPSAISGLLSIFIIFLLGKSLYSDKEGIISAGLTAVLWAPIYYSQEARPYSPLLMFTMLSTYLWISILWRLYENGKPSYYITLGYVASAVISSYLHYFGLYLIALQGLGAFLFFFRNRRQILYISIIYSAITLLYAPWIPSLIYQIGKDWSINESYIKTPEFIPFFIGYLGFLFNSSNLLTLLVAILYLFLLFVNVRNILKTKEYRNTKALLLSPLSILLLWLTVPYIIMYFKSILSQPVLTYRNLIISLPPAYILLARAMTQLPYVSKRYEITILIMIPVLLYHLIFQMDYYSKPMKTQFREGVYYVIEHDTNLKNSIIASSYSYLNYYFIRKGYNKMALVGGGPFSYSTIEKEVNEKRPYYIWYLNSHNFPTEEYAYHLYKNFDLSLITHKKFLQLDVYLFHTPYLKDDIDKGLSRGLDVSYLGFYDAEKWPPEYHTWRWSKKEGVIGIPKKGITIELTLQGNHPDIEKDPVTVDLFLNNKPLDKIAFTRDKRVVTNRYYIPSSIKGIPQIRLNVSRTWNPYKYGISKDNRDLGIAVGEIKFIDKFPEDGVGFYGWEEIKGRHIQEWQGGLPIRFRWTGLHASMNVDNIIKDSLTIFMHVAHHDVEDNPVKVEVIGNKGILREVTFADKGWKKVILSRKELEDTKVLTFHVSRTWNPELAGVSDDSRDLGVAVAISEIQALK